MTRLCALAGLLVSFSISPSARAASPAVDGLRVERAGDGARIAFALSHPSDVEVAILDASGKAVRHLAAGVLGDDVAAPAPLRAGLSQQLEWDGKDDAGKTARGGPFRVRVRTGMQAR